MSLPRNGRAGFPPGHIINQAWEIAMREGGAKENCRRAGVNSGFLAYARRGGNPSLLSFEAILNHLGYRLVIRKLGSRKP
jgi:DNA-binding phage protein